MSREIKFRGMDLQGRWFHGNLAILHKDLKSTGNKAGHYISNSAGAPFAYAIRPETVGQYTGLKDKNGKGIYEGDILSGYNGGYLYVIQYFQPDCRYIAVHAEDYVTGKWDDADEAIGLVWVECEVIGNIYEHPHLLTEEVNTNESESSIKHHTDEQQEEKEADKG